ncbi:MAG: glycosyltransferase family 2 protein [Pseudomonadota bacterium]
MSVAVAIVNYGTAQMVISALPALRCELAPLPRRAVFIVDNASTGDDAVLLADHLATSGPDGSPDPEVRLIVSAVNGGFAAGNNLAFAVIRDLNWTPDAVLMLNPDAEMRPGALREMLAVLAARPEAGFVGPRLENSDGSTWTAAFRFPSAMSEFAGATGVGALTRRWPVVLPESVSPMQVDWVTGAAMLARWDAIEDVGGMDEGFFLYYEEIDFMRRAAAKGWGSWHAPAARVLHEAGGATGMLDGKPREGRMPDYWFQSWRRYFAKSHGAVYARAAAMAKLLGMAIGTAQRRLRGLPYGKTPGFWGDFLRKGLLGPMDLGDEGRAP